MQVETKAAAAVDKRPEMKILVPSAIILLLIMGSAILAPGPSEKILSIAFKALMRYTGSFFLWANLAVAILCGYFMFSKYGDIKFGKPDEKPEFKTLPWVAMIFCSVIAGAIMFWSFIEPLYHLMDPPMYAKPLSVMAYEWALSYTLFDFSFVFWPWFLLPALPVCYMYYIRKNKSLRTTSTCSEVLGKQTNGFWGMVLEILIVVGMFLANAATMGVAIPIIIEAIAYVFGFKVSLSLTVATLLAITVLFTTSVYLGLKKGIQRLSTINVVVGILMVVYMWIVGPTIDIFDIFTNSVGRMFAELPALLLSTDPFTKSTVPQDWSIFFILWEVAYGPFMAIFIARISRGRTVRQIIGYGMLGGVAAVWTIHGTFGSYSLWVMQHGVLDSVKLLQESGGPATLIAIMSTIPLGKMMLIVFALFSIISMATAVDSGSFTIASMVSRNLPFGEDPTKGHRLFWAMIQGGVGLAVIVIGGLGTVKMFVNFSGGLIFIPYVILIIAWFKMLKTDKVNEALNTRPNMIAANRPEPVTGREK